MIKFYWFALRWLWRHRYWENSRQKWKALDRDYQKYKRGNKQ